MPSRPVPPLDACFRPAACWRGWGGLLMVVAGLGAAGLAPLKSAAPEPGRRSFLPASGPKGVLEGQGLARTRQVLFGARAAPFRVVDDRRNETVNKTSREHPWPLNSAPGR